MTNMIPYRSYLVVCGFKIWSKIFAYTMNCMKIIWYLIKLYITNFITRQPFVLIVKIFHSGSNNFQPRRPRAQLKQELEGCYLGSHNLKKSFWVVHMNPMTRIWKNTEGNFSTRVGSMLTG